MHSHRLRVLSPALILAGLSGSVLGATPVVVSNTSNLLPNTAGQQIEFFISGTDQIAGEDINVQTNAGTSGPLITGIDIIDGTIFGGANTGQNGQGIDTAGSYNGHLAFVTTTTDVNVAPTVLDNGLLLTLTVSTVGLSQGSTFQLNLVNNLNGPSNVVLSDATNVFFTQTDVNFALGTVDRQWTGPMNGNGTGTWSPDANWAPFAPYAPGDAADFYGVTATAGNTTATVTVDGPRVVGALNFNNTSMSYSLIPQNATVGSLELNNNGLAPMINDSAGSHSIATPIQLDGNTNVTVVRGGDSLTISGNISGAANMAFAGSGTTVLTGNNSYAATSIGGGATVQVGSGSNTGTLGTGAVTDNGTLVFERNDATSISNLISGTGGLTNGGTGTVSLTTAVNLGGNVNAIAGLLDFGGVVTHNVGAVNIGAGGLKVDSGTTLVSGPVSAQSTGTWTIAGTDQIHQGLLTAGTSVINALPTFVGSGQLDITDDKLIVQSTGATGSKASLISSLETLVNEGKGSGAWTGPGITSSVVANDTVTATNHTYHTTVAIADNGALTAPFTTYGGQPVDTSSILVTRALIGDGNLDSTTNNADLVILLNHFGASGATQSSGDYDGNGTVNNADLVALLNDFGQSLPGGFSLTPAGGSGVGAASPVPEPASLGLLAVGGAALMVRRRKPKLR